MLGPHSTPRENKFEIEFSGVESIDEDNWGARPDHARLVLRTIGLGQGYVEMPVEIERVSWEFAEGTPLSDDKR